MCYSARMIRVDQATKRFGDHAAVDGVSIEIGAGTTTALIGPSGCGKSTLLRLMMGLIEPDEGRVLFDDRPIGEGDVRATRARLGYAIQSGGLFPHLTARKNIELPARRHAMTAAATRGRIDELAAMTHLSPELLDRFPGELSGGQRQRVALMRALVLDPEALLLDEPLGALDPMIRAELQHELRELFARLGKAVVLVTHDLAEAAYLAPDDIVLLRRGRVVQRGPFETLRREPAEDFVSEFIGAQTERVEALLVGSGP